MFDQRSEANKILPERQSRVHNFLSYCCRNLISHEEESNSIVKVYKSTLTRLGSINQGRINLEFCSVAHYSNKRTIIYEINNIYMTLITCPNSHDLSDFDDSKRIYRLRGI